MKLCFLAAANSIHSFRWIKYFANQGHDVHWISLVPSEYPDLPNTTFYDLSSGRGKLLTMARAVLRVRRLVGTIQPDVMHAHYAGSYGVLGAASGFQPFVLTAWGSDVLFAAKTPILGALVRWALQTAKIITCDAYHMVEAMVVLGIDRTKIHLNFFGIEVDRFYPGKADVAVVNKWGAQDRSVVISLRSLEPVYDIGTLLDAVPAVTSVFPDVLFVIYGGGSQASLLKQHASDTKIERNVLFAGRFDHANLPQILRSAKVYVSTSLSDGGLAASTQEAMACGVPVVVTNTGENNKWIDDGASGFLFAAHDSATLAERIIALLCDSPLRAGFGEASRATIVERNNYAIEMSRMEQQYESLARGAEL